MIEFNEVIHFILAMSIIVVHLINNYRFNKILEGMDLLREIDEDGYTKNKHRIIKLEYMVEKEIDIRRNM